MIAAQATTRLARFCLAADVLDEDDAEAYYYVLRKRARTFLGVAAHLQNEITDLSTPRLNFVDRIVHKNIGFDTFTDQYFREKMKMSRDQCRDLFYNMAIPAHFTLNKRDAAFEVSGVHCFLYWLFRYTSPSRRLSDDQVEWGYDYTVLGKMLNVVVDYIDQTHRFRLQRLPEAVRKFPYFNQCIVRAIQRNFPDQPLPPEALRCAVFGDCCRYRVARPWVCQ